ncbi:MAG TPA: sigma-70 family RNA polymerase sigma factor [Verrucomicrobiae bacterium]|nr:sigma-70 family RNA polymerase sigma factor [Verrucomicrobiae bacterium]
MDRVIQPAPKDSGPDAEKTLSDHELLLRCRAGDETAFEDLVLRHQQRAFNVAFQILRDREDATEVAQDAFVRIYRSVSDFRGECEFTTWLHQIVLNLARNKHRWWKRRGRHASVSLDATRELEDGDAPMQMAVSGDAPDVETVKAEFVERLSREMEELPQKFREVLVLRNAEGLSYEQIAKVLDCSIGTVKSRIARAREMLRQSMKDES